ncbi:hypothetical protein Zmor_020196 [Zophobas morio]|uniref:Uncharacterized protein n=1 Tax=Zophobas morio TaxID=2755281 RepID=A0AA38I7D9_9CUCU|nr:hypothetical protein Zmor_020196 [Zophobas morio]
MSTKAANQYANTHAFQHNKGISLSSPKLHNYKLQLPHIRINFHTNIKKKKTKIDCQFPQDAGNEFPAKIPHYEYRRNSTRQKLLRDVSQNLPLLSGKVKMHVQSTPPAARPAKRTQASDIQPNCFNFLQAVRACNTSRQRQIAEWRSRGPQKPNIEVIVSRADSPSQTSTMML